MLIFSVFSAEPEDTPATLLESHLWQDRIIVVFSPELENSQRKEQLTLFKNMQQGVKERDIVIYDVVQRTHVAKDGKIFPHIPASRFYDAYNISDEAFTVLLFGKDGELKLQQSSVLLMNMLFETIDAMPMRQRESQ